MAATVDQVLHDASVTRVFASRIFLIDKPGIMTGAGYPERTAVFSSC
jgi:hypothetical protein